MTLFLNFESDTSPIKNWVWGKSLDLDLGAVSNIDEASSNTVLNYQLIKNNIFSRTEARQSNVDSYTRKMPDKSIHPRIKLKIITDSAVTAEPVEKLFTDFNNLVVTLVDDYTSGRKDISDLVHELGGKWSPSSVVVLLERFGAHRNAMTSKLSIEDKANILRKLADIRASNQSHIYNDREWIQREVIASQRIELIDVAIEDFIE